MLTEKLIRLPGPHFCQLLGYRSHEPAILRALEFHGVPVPTVHFATDDYMIIDDLGSVRLCDEPRPGHYAALEKSMEKYQPIHLPFVGKMGPEYFLLHQRQFSRQYLEHYSGWDRPRALAFEAHPEAEALRDGLAVAPNVLCHGDLHSRNVMIAKGVPHLIDVGGFIRGPQGWDAACLTFDPWGPDPKDLSAAPLACAIQRLFGLLGNLCWLGMKGRTDMMEAIPATRNLLFRCLAASPAHQGLFAMLGTQLRTF